MFGCKGFCPAGWLEVTASADKYLPNTKKKTGQGQKLFW